MRQLSDDLVAAMAAPAAAAAGFRLRVGKVCVAIQAGSPAELLDRAEAALKDTRFIEFRLDSLPKPAAAMPYLRQFLSEHKDVTANCDLPAQGESAATLWATWRRSWPC